MRAFLALDLPEPLRDALGPVQDRLPPIARVVPEDDLHLTLAFLGDVRLEALEELHLDLETLRPGPMPLRVAGIDIFGESAPRSVHARVAPAAALVELQRKLATLARRAGIDLPRRRFVPHVTLARFPRGMEPEDHARVGRFLAAHGDLALETHSVDRLSLMNSTLSGDGPRYDLLESYALA